MRKGKQKGKGCAGVEEHIVSESESGSDEESDYLKWVKQNRKEVRSKLAEIFEMVCNWCTKVYACFPITGKSKTYRYAHLGF